MCDAVWAPRFGERVAFVRGLSTAEGKEQDLIDVSTKWHPPMTQVMREQRYHRPLCLFFRFISNIFT